MSWFYQIAGARASRAGRKRNSLLFLFNSFRFHDVIRAGISRNF